ncbi:hypothetical protein ACSQ67_025191 [Phaseolus vulgaris]
MEAWVLVMEEVEIGNSKEAEVLVMEEVDWVSPFDLAANWRAYQDNFRPSSVRWIPDVSINSAPQTGGENCSSVGLELDLEHYVVPTPVTSANTAHVYAANLTENPRSPVSGCGSYSSPIKAVAERKAMTERKAVAERSRSGESTKAERSRSERARKRSVRGGARRRRRRNAAFAMGIKELASRGNIRLKRMGELDTRPFLKAIQRRYKEEEVGEL